MTSKAASPFKYCAMISLASAIQRRERTLEDAPYDFNIIEAVDGRALSLQQRSILFNDKKALRYYRRMLTPGEVGCTLSHLKAIRQFISETDNDKDLALIIEDDAVFSPDATNIFNKLVSVNVDFLLLWTSTQRIAKYSPVFSQLCTIGQDRNVLRSPPFMHGAVGYIISRRAAVYLSSLVPDGGPFWLADDPRILLRNNIDFCFTYPALVNYHELGDVTQIHLKDQEYVSYQSDSLKALNLHLPSRFSFRHPGFRFCAPLSAKLWLKYAKIINSLDWRIRTSRLMRLLSRFALVTLEYLSVFESLISSRLLKRIK